MLEQITALAPDPYHDGALCGLADGRVIYQGWGSSQLSNKTSLAFSGRVKSLSLSSTGRRILAITERGDVAVAGLDTQRDVGSGAYLDPSFDPLLGEFSPNGRFVVLVGAAPTIHQEEEDGDDLGEFRQAYNTPRDLCIDGVRGRPILKELCSFKTDSRPLGISFTSDRTGLIYSTVKGTVVRLSLFNVSGAECLPKVQVLSSQSDLISASQISSNSIGQVAFDRSVMQLDGDFASLGFNPSFELPIPRGSRVRHAWSPCEDILALSWLADGKPNLRVVSGTQRDRFGRPKVLSEFMLHSDVPVLAFTPRGDQLIACGTDCSLSVYGARD
jgi:WD40 repeat protein